MKTALISGITGQDGSYLSELLIEKGYSVHGIIRRSSTFNTGRINHLFELGKQGKIPFYLHHGDLSDASCLNRILEKTEPDEIYNLGAQSHVKVSFDIPEYTGDITGLGTLRLLDAIHQTRLKTRFFQSSSSEMFGKVTEIPQKESTAFHPRSPYGIAKLYAHWMTINYRESYNMFAATGIMFNHESPRRGQTFVTRKIVEGLVKYKLGLEKTLTLGNLEAKRDWGYAKDYMEAVWMILQHHQPDDFVISTGNHYSVREFLEATLDYLKIVAVSNNKTGVNEEYTDKKSKSVVVAIDEKYFRPAEVDTLLGDSTKIQKILGWTPKMSFKELVAHMCDEELKRLSE